MAIFFLGGGGGLLTIFYGTDRAGGIYKNIP